MDGICFPRRIGIKRLQLIVLGLLVMPACGGSSRLLGAPQTTHEQEKSSRIASLMQHETGLTAPLATVVGNANEDRPAIPTLARPARQAQASVSDQSSMNWESPARLHRGLKGSSGNLRFSLDGVDFRPTAGSLVHWQFSEIQTFDLLTPQHLVITGYENRGWHLHGEKKCRFDLSKAMPPEIAADLARLVIKPVRNGNPNPSATTFATIPARHRTVAGGTNGTLRFGAEGIDYVTTSGKDGRAWRWSDIQTLANPDPFSLRVHAYRETFTFELKQPMPKDLYDRLWSQIEARDLNRLDANGSKENR